MKRDAVLIVPAVVAVLANQTDYLPFKMGVPALCALILLLVFGRRLRLLSDIWFVVAAFIFSAVGDYFLSNKSGHEMYFVIGIGAYFVAHLGYLGFALRSGRLHWIALGVLLLGFLPYYFLSLNPAIDDPVLSVSVLLYLLISCVAFAAAFGMYLPRPVKAWYVFGIFLIVLSDTIISFNEFLGYRELNWLILPTYYLAHLCVTLTVLRRADAADAGPRIALDLVRKRE